MTATVLRTMALLSLLAFLLGCPSDNSDDTPAPEGRYKTVAVTYRGSLYQVVIDTSTDTTIDVQKRVRNPTTGKPTWNPVKNKNVRIAVSVAAASATGAGASAPLKGERSASLQLQPELYLLESLGASGPGEVGLDRLVIVQPEGTAPEGELTIPRETRGIILSPDRKQLYLLHRAAEPLGALPAEPPRLSVVDLAARRVSHTYMLQGPLQISFSGKPFDISPDGRLLFITHTGDFVQGRYENGAVRIVETATGRQVGSIPMPPPSTGAGTVPVTQIEVSPDGEMAWAYSNSEVVVIDSFTQTVSASFRIAGGIEGIRFHPDGTRAYAAGRSAAVVVETATLQIRKTIPLENAVSVDGLELTPDGLDLFLHDDGPGIEWRIDTRTEEVTQTLAYARDKSSFLVAAH